MTKSQAEWEKMFYGRSGSLPEEGSQAFWKAFKELGWTNWTPASDVEVVVQKLQEIGERLDWGPERVKKDIEKARENFARYKRYEPQYVNGEIHEDWSDV